MKSIKSFKQYNNINEKKDIEVLEDKLKKFTEEEFGKWFKNIKVEKKDTHEIGNSTIEDIQVSFNIGNIPNGISIEEFLKNVEKEYKKRYLKFKTFYEDGIRGIINTFSKKNKLIEVEVLAAVYVSEYIENSFRNGTNKIVCYDSDGKKQILDDEKTFSERNTDIKLNNVYVYIDIFTNTY